MASTCSRGGVHGEFSLCGRGGGAAEGESDSSSLVLLLLQPGSQGLRKSAAQGSSSYEGTATEASLSGSLALGRCWRAPGGSGQRQGSGRQRLGLAQWLRSPRRLRSWRYTAANRRCCPRSRNLSRPRLLRGAVRWPEGQCGYPKAVLRTALELGDPSLRTEAQGGTSARAAQALSGHVPGCNQARQSGNDPGGQQKAKAHTLYRGQEADDCCRKLLRAQG
mmetsp:Transcript_92202/g.192790  ORF Transcript_92202/g.192790 Transcript_92202/m.192790 type:complete len:221 (-) Transcript_92202:595-1257(-)